MTPVEFLLIGLVGCETLLLIGMWVHCLEAGRRLTRSERHTEKLLGYLDRAYARLNDNAGCEPVEMDDGDEKEAFEEPTTVVIDDAHKLAVARRRAAEQRDRDEAVRSVLHGRR